MITPPNEISFSTIFYKPEPFYDLCEINGSKFAIFRKPIESNLNISLDFTDHNVVFLSPLEAKTDIMIKAISVIVLANINSTEGASTILGTGKFLNLGNKIWSKQKILISCDKQIISTFIIPERREMIKNIFNEAILKKDGELILDALCQTYDAYKDPYDENSEGFDIRQVFEFFDIPLTDNSCSSECSLMS